MVPRANRPFAAYTRCIGYTSLPCSRSICAAVQARGTAGGRGARTLGSAQLPPRTCCGDHSLPGGGRHHVRDVRNLRTRSWRARAPSQPGFVASSMRTASSSRRHYLCAGCRGPPPARPCPRRQGIARQRTPRASSDTCTIFNTRTHVQVVLALTPLLQLRRNACH